MFATSSFILRVAVPSPVREYFDYLPPSGVVPEQLQAGLRVKIPFGRRILIGIIISIEPKAPLPSINLSPY